MVDSSIRPNVQFNWKLLSNCTILNILSFNFFLFVFFFFLFFTEAKMHKFYLIGFHLKCKTFSFVDRFCSVTKSHNSKCEEKRKKKITWDSNKRSKFQLRPFCITVHQRLTGDSLNAAIELTVGRDGQQQQRQRKQLRVRARTLFEFLLRLEWSVWADWGETFHSSLLKGAILVEAECNALIYIAVVVVVVIAFVWCVHLSWIVILDRAIIGGSHWQILLTLWVILFVTL